VRASSRIADGCAWPGLTRDGRAGVRGRKGGDHERRHLQRQHSQISQDGVSAQREIEKAVRQALAEGKLKGNEKFPATGTITLGGIGLSHEVKGEIELE
jgi:hypothetical protein